MIKIFASGRYQFVSPSRDRPSDLHGRRHPVRSPIQPPDQEERLRSGQYFFNNRVYSVTLVQK
jgi:hypothetical protein